MKNLFVQTSNVAEFMSLAEKLTRVEAGVPGMALVHGAKGLGKTTVAIHYSSKKENRAVYVRGKSDWSYTWMMEEILVELGITPRRGEKAKFDDLVNGLLETPRLVIVDETNMVKPRLLETLRSIHDITGNPFLFIGHEGVVNGLLRLGPFWDRLLYKAELKPLNADDLAAFCAKNLEVGIDKNALETVLKVADGNFRKSVVRLKQLEDRAKMGRVETITPELLKGLN